jgi:hypothetical protein
MRRTPRLEASAVSAGAETVREGMVVRVPLARQTPGVVAAAETLKDKADRVARV